MSVTAELTRIAQRDGVLTPEVVLAEATAEESPLHSLFEWDDTKAGIAYRLHQAATLIRRCKISVETAPDTYTRVRAFTNIPEAEGYLPTEDALLNHRDVVFEQCKRDIAALRKKYGHLIDFETVLRVELDVEVAAA